MTEGSLLSVQQDVDAGHDTADQSSQATAHAQSTSRRRQANAGAGLNDAAARDTGVPRIFVDNVPVGGAPSKQEHASLCTHFLRS